MLLCFTACTFCSYAWFRNQAQRPFEKKWKLALLLTGLSIGCVSSVKWVGFFVTALVGLMTMDELWGMLGDTKMSKVPPLPSTTDALTLPRGRVENIPAPLWVARIWSDLCADHGLRYLLPVPL